MQTIVIKYHGPTNTRGGYIVAKNVVFKDGVCSQ